MRNCCLISLTTRTFSSCREYDHNSYWPVDHCNPPLLELCTRDVSSGQICADTGNVHWGRTRQTRQGPRRPVQGSLYPCVPIFAKVRLVTTVACTAGNRQEDYRQREKETHYRRRKHWIVYRVLDRPCLRFRMILTLTSLGVSIKRGIRILRSTDWPAAKLQMVGVRILYVRKRTT